jgi:hypothetical protein
MTDIVFETVRMLIVSGLFIYLWRSGHSRQLANRGWTLILLGSALIALGSAIDVTDNFPSLNKFVLIGDTPTQAFIEKVICSVGGISLCAVGLLLWIPTISSLEKVVKAHADLAMALEEVKTLSGLLPICAKCKSVRDDKGYWNDLDTYVHNHSEVQFSHGICPGCLEESYAEMGLDPPGSASENHEDTTA